jgi:hypothetical protein
MWLGLAHFHNGYSFLTISPNLHDIWPVFFLILSRYETAHFLIVLRPSGDGYSLAAKNSLRGTTGISFLTISPKLLDIWPIFLLVFSPIKTALLLILF